MTAVHPEQDEMHLFKTRVKRLIPSSVRKRLKSLKQSLTGGARRGNHPSEWEVPWEKRGKA